MEEKKEGGAVVCPIDLSWLVAVYRWMPKEIWRRSKLAKYEVCILSYIESGKKE